MKKNRFVQILEFEYCWKYSFWCFAEPRKCFRSDICLCTVYVYNPRYIHCLWNYILIWGEIITPNRHTIHDWSFPIPFVLTIIYGTSYNRLTYVYLLLMYHLEKVTQSRLVLTTHESNISILIRGANIVDILKSYVLQIIWGQLPPCYSQIPIMANNVLFHTLLTFLKAYLILHKTFDLLNKSIAIYWYLMFYLWCGPGTFERARVGVEDFETR